MKTKILLLSSALILALSLNYSYAIQSKFRISIVNLNSTSERELEFDIVLYNISESKDLIRYSAGQYVLLIDPQIANGGDLTYSILNSDLPDLLSPVNASVSGNQLRLACNMPQINNTPEISDKGILIARMKLETSARKFSSDPLHLGWTDGNSIFRTKICVNDGETVREIADSEIEFTGINSEKNNISSSADFPKEFSLAQNFPNPFNPVTKISFEIPASGFVNLKIYDITGREISSLVNENLNAGTYNVQFDGAGYASGVYFYKITAGNFSEIRKMFLIK